MSLENQQNNPVQKASTAQKYLVYSGLALGGIFVVIGIVFALMPGKTVLSPNAARMVGGLISLYGAFRFWRAWVMYSNWKKAGKL